MGETRIVPDADLARVGGAAGVDRMSIGCASGALPCTVLSNGRLKGED
jgi:hypothetical protein